MRPTQVLPKRRQQKRQRPIIPASNWLPCVLALECYTAWQLGKAVAWIAPRRHHRTPISARIWTQRAFPMRHEGVELFSSKSSSTLTNDTDSTVNIVSPPSSDKEWYDLYKTVALQDPEWFERHVISLTSGVDDGGDILVDDELIRLAQQAKEQRMLPSQEDPLPVDSLESATTSDVGLIPIPLIDRSNAKVDAPQPDPPISLVIPLVPVFTSLPIDTDATVKTLVATDDDGQMTNRSSFVSTAANVEMPISSPDISILQDVNLDEKPSVVGTESLSSSPNEKTQLLMEDASTNATIPFDDRVVLFLDESMVWNRVDLATLLQLGYSETEIILLQPTVLRLIAADVIFRPRTGVPVRWLSSAETKDDGSGINVTSLIPLVQIVSAAGATAVLVELQRNVTVEMNLSVVEISRDGPIQSSINPIETTMKTERSEVNAVLTQSLSEEEASNDSLEVPATREASFRDTSSSSETKERYPAKSNSDVKPSKQMETNDTTRRPLQTEENLTPRRESQLPPLSSVDPPPRRTSVEERNGRESRGPVRSSDEASSSQRARRVFNGRSAPVSSSGRPKRVDDPPPPTSGVWPDLDTFRNLLREEAGLRLRILGSDWSDAVKDESDWRLDLYQDWLWTLHRGWGDPMVESRSDRARRNRPSPTMPSPSPPSPSPRSRARKSRNDEGR